MISLFWVLSFIWTTKADCECGYQVGSERYTNAIQTDFSRFLDVGDISDGSGDELDDWEVQDWSTNATTRGTEKLLVKKNDPSNVWIQGGLLQLRQKAYSDQDKTNGKPVSIAEIVTRRDDILYGSFRARYKIVVQEHTNGGAVSGFFFYHGDASETDIEILTRDDDTSIHYSQQPTYNYVTDTSYEDASLTDSLSVPWTELQEHRWDWHPDITRFYQDGQEAAQLTVNTPQQKGRIMINIWADGGNWSGRPADKDVIMEIQTIELFFNTSLSYSGGDINFNTACEKAGGYGDTNTICVVDKASSKNTTSSAVHLQSWVWHGGVAWAVLILSISFVIVF
ncbi:concanavalin A-like lectin/glucanase [Terfezia boudieri ATCC MYA-4762]|uniref:Concanavalin A-like lectin/glucanase n=1 Tax=Terfezia boudieri ATCC MYA-4762 TaxID=1051890 RepID=A0A3N4LUJ2_9PEZI|nr:concanavalin A-like lectin/glucanase [Terfezia boudieri ATCC MYA-4762]